MLEQNKITGKTLVPIGVIVALAGVCIWIGSLANQVKTLTFKDSPSRDEYNQMCSTMAQINNKLDTLILRTSAFNNLELKNTKQGG